MLTYSDDYPKINRIAETKYGKLRGAWGDRQSVTVFRGVPYGKPPVGQLRWHPPVEPDCWAGVRDALEFSPRAYQPEDDDENGFYKNEFRSNPVVNSEDCLYLNIWTPKVEPGAGYPVMFWIHGGGLHGGYGFEAPFDGEAFCKNGVILVSINYRLGMLGFYANTLLSEENEHHVSGNYGYMDQIAALKWVRENIYNFGGNPDNITVFGQSAGAGSVMNLVTSPLSKDMMSKAIMQSGVSLFKFGSPQGVGLGFTGIPLLKEQEALGDEFMASLGCKTLDELRQIHPFKLMTAPGTGFGKRFTFGPCIDGYLMKESSVAAIRKGLHADIPYLVGGNSDEGNLTGQVERLEDFMDMGRRSFGDQMDDFLKAAASDQMDVSDARRLLSDMDVMRTGSRLFGEIQSAGSRKNAWVYYFKRQLPGGSEGAFHSAELWYVFNSLRKCWRSMTREDYDLGGAMNAYWCNFAKNGNPNGDGLPLWEAYTSKKPTEMHLDLICRMEPAQMNPAFQFIKAYIGQEGDHERKFDT